jgi:hypothetical protein
MLMHSTWCKILFAILLVALPFGRGAQADNGNPTLRDFAILHWPSSDLNLQLHWGVRVNGSICAGTVAVGPWTTMTGDVVALNTTGTAIAFAPGDAVSGKVITGGGAIINPAYATIGGAVDTNGQAPEVANCSAAASAVAAARTQMMALPPTLILPALAVPKGATRRIPDTGTLGAGQIVIDTPRIDLAGTATLVLVGDPSTTQVIVRTSEVKMRFHAQLALDGLQPEQVLYVIEHTALLYEFDTVAGSLMAKQITWAGKSGRSRIDGTLLSGSTLSVGSFTTINPHPFAGF